MEESFDGSEHITTCPHWYDSEKQCNIQCKQVMDALSLKQPSVSKAGDESIRKGEYERGYQDGAYQVVQDMGRNIKDPEPQSNREDVK